MNKFLAKIASGLNKSNGLNVFDLIQAGHETRHPGHLKLATDDLQLRKAAIN
jgi:hypothetical protein